MRSAVLLLTLSACLDSSVHDCGNGFLCPANLVCVPGQERCVLPDQLAACNGKADGAMCTFSGVQNGTCQNGVCIATTALCGNGMIDQGEICDGAPPVGQTCLDYSFDTGSLGCSSQCVPSVADCRRIGWITMESPLHAPIHAVWGSSPTDVYAAGEAFIHFNGLRWSTAVPGNPTFGAPSAIWGTGANDVWVSAPTPGGPGMFSIFHYDGSGWTMVTPTGANVVANAIWGSATDDVYFTSGDQILHFDGQSISTAYSAPPMTGFGGIWGSGRSDVYAVGYVDLYHFDGTRWAPAGVGCGGNVLGVWGSGPRDVYATCTQGIVHFDGTTWTRLAPRTSFGAIWGSGPGDVFAVNSMGIAHFDGTRWIQMTGVSSGPRSGMVNAISGTGPRDVFAVGADGLILHYQGSAWVFWLGPPGAIKAMWGSSANDVYGVGNGFILHYDGTSWMSVTPPNARAFTAVWGSGPSDVYVTSGDDFPPMVYITHFNGSTWSEIIPPPGDDPGNGLTAIWGSGPHDVWAVGGRDIVVMTHYDGTGWTPVTMAPGLIAPITSLWGSGPNDIYAVGPIPPPGPAGGYPIYHWSGGPGWTALSVTSPGPLSAVWGSGPNDIYLTGTDLLLHYDGTSLTRIATAGQDLDALWGSGPSDVFAAGKAGSLLHFDGQQWLPIRVLLPMPDLSAMWGASAEDFWLGVGGSPVELVRTVLPGP